MASASPHIIESEAKLGARLHRMGNGFWISQGIYVVAKLGVADHMSDEARPVSEIASAVGASSEALYRIMRMLAAEGVFTEPQKHSMALTPMGQLLRRDHPGTLRQQFLGITELDWFHWGHLLDCVRDGGDAMHRLHGKGLFEYLQDNPAIGRMFDEAMTGFVTENGLAVIAAYDFGQFKTMVDVGGGVGTFMTALLKAQASLSGTVFDLPAVIASAKKNVATQGLASRCDCVAGNFFESVPEGGQAYVAVSIIHDWDDDNSLAILRNIRKVIPANGKLLLVEMVVPEGDTPSYSKLLDVNMLVLTGGKERTEAEYRELGARAGFRLSGVTPTRGPSGILEFVPI